MKDSIERIIKKVGRRRSCESDPQESKRIYPGKSYGSRKNIVSAQKLKRKLLEEYRGKEVETVLDVEKIDNDYGSVLSIEKKYPVDWWSLQDPCEQIMSDLQLIYGIGPVTEDQLKKNGYGSIEDLTEHPDWCDKVEHLMNEVNFESPGEAKRLISRWKPASHPLNLSLAALFEREDFAILDIETLGLTHQPIILFAVAEPGTKEMTVRQFLLKDIRQEPAALLEFKRILENKKAYITYNGKRFDIPYLNRRFNFYGLKVALDGIHFDLYQFARNRWSDQIPDCTLNTVERQKLGIRRDMDIPSELVPEFYKTYQNTGNPGPLLPLLQHNRQDVVSLQKLFSKLGTGFEEDNCENKENY